MQNFKDLEPYRTNGYELSYAKIIVIIVKNTIIQIFSIIIGGVTSSLGNWDKSQNNYILKIRMLCILGILYTAFVIASIIIDNRIDKVMYEKLYRTRIIKEIYENVLSKLASIDFYVANLLEMSKNNSNKKDYYIHEIEKLYFILCSDLYDIISKYDSGKFGVSYSKRIDSKYVSTIAYRTCDMRAPNFYHKKINLKKCNYFMAKIMNENVKNLSGVVSLNKQEIFENFVCNDYYSIDKYYLYIAIPVVKNKKVDGIFQIVYYTESDLLSNEENLKVFCEKIFSQYIGVVYVIDQLCNLLGNV